MADIQQVRYDLNSAPVPGFMDYAAQFLQSYQGEKKANRENEQKALMQLIPALAAQQQIRPGGPIPYPGVPGGFSIVPPSTSLPGYENIPGVSDWGDLGQMYNAKEKEAWFKGEITPRMAEQRAAELIRNSLAYVGKPEAEQVKAMESTRDFFLRGKEAKPSIETKPQKAIAPIRFEERDKNGKMTYRMLPLEATYKGKKVYLGSDGQYYTAEELQ